MNEELKIFITAEIDRLKEELTEAQKAVEETAKKGESNFKKFGEASQKAGKVVAGAMVAAVAALGALAESTREYRTEQAKLVSAFESAGASAEQAKTTYNDLYRVLGDTGQATEAANHLALLTTNEKELAEWTNICQGVYATFGDSLPIEGLTEAANETAKVGQVTGGLADALNWAGISEDAFNEKLAALNTEAEREKLIRETLNGVYSEASANYEKNAGDILNANDAQRRLTDGMAALGAAVEPVMTALKNMAATVMEQLAPALQEFMDEHGEKITTFLGELAESIGAVIGFILDNIEIIGTIAGIILAIAAAVSVYNAVMAVYNIVMAPVNLTIIAIVAAIVALIAIIKLVITYWDEIAKACVGAWKTIMGVLSGVGTWIYNTVIKPVVNFFGGMWKGLIQGAKDAWKGVKQVFSAVASFFGNIFSTAWEGVKKVFSTGGKIFDGIKEGIVTAFKAVVNAIITGINKVVALPFNGLNDILNTLQNVSFLGISPFSWLSWRAPVPQLPYLAKGGIVDSATLAVVGERGKEAVMPLENNTEWMDMLAERIRGGNSMQPIILQVDGRTFAEVSINSINRLTRQTGKLALNLV